MGKGSVRRPPSVAEQEWRHRWDCVFDTEKPPKCGGLAKTTQKEFVSPAGKERAQ